MSVTVEHRGRFILRGAAKDKLKAGDILVVVRQEQNQLVLKKQSRKPSLRRDARDYLTPSVLSRAALDRVYTRKSPEWDKVEAEAVRLAQEARRSWRPELM